MTLKNLYNSFYINHKYDDLKVYYLKLKEMIDLISMKESLEDELRYLEENELEKVKSNKVSFVTAYYNFIDYLVENGYIIEFKKKRVYDTSTRRLELIKFLQVPRKKDDVLNEFWINERTFNSDIKAIEDGIDFFGTKIQISLSKYKRNGTVTVDEEEFHSTCNPFALALNMSELFFLTNIIPSRIKDPDEKIIYRKIIKKIYPQLTDYSLNLMGITEPVVENTFNSEFDQLKEDVRMQIIYLAKSGLQCEVIYIENGERKKVKGTIIHCWENEFHVEQSKNKIVKIEYENFLGITDFKKIYR